MGVVIGAGTTIQGSLAGQCVISVNWACNPNVQRLYCLGSFSPAFQYARPTQTMSMVIYSPGSYTYDTTASDDCNLGNFMSAGVTPAGCGENVIGVSLHSDWVVNSYGYSKDDPNLPGQETWGIQRWPSSGDADCDVGGSVADPPTHIVRGISEGQAAKESDNSDPGISFTGTLSYSVTGNVSAGGVGRADRLTYGVVTSIGGSASTTGLTGQGSVSVPYTPLWV